MTIQEAVSSARDHGFSFIGAEPDPFPGALGKWINAKKFDNGVQVEVRWRSTFVPQWEANCTFKQDGVEALLTFHGRAETLVGAVADALQNYQGFCDAGKSALGQVDLAMKVHALGFSVGDTVFSEYERMTAKVVEIHNRDSRCLRMDLASDDGYQAFNAPCCYWRKVGE